MKRVGRWFTSKYRFQWNRKILIFGLIGALLALLLAELPAPAQTNGYCQFTQQEVDQKEQLRRAAFEGDETARRQYEALIKQHLTTLQRCRSRSWPNHQAIWLRLYPCDLQPGILDALMDRIVNLGYDQVYLEVFYSGQVLLPQADNPTLWPSVVQAQGYEDRDLMAETIAKGHERGLKVYAWVFTMNFGYTYAQRPDRQQALARNGYGQDTLHFASSGSTSNPDEVFIDPYHPDAIRDYQQMLQAVMQRRPDGVLFDYVRYPRGLGTASVVSKVSDLWIYGPASQQALYQRALNNKGLELMRRFLARGYLIDADITEVDSLYPNEGEPLWQGRVPPPAPLPNEDGEIVPVPASQRRPILQDELWRLSVAHAIQGVVDFLSRAAYPYQQAGFETGAVFFPNGNQTVGQQGYDSRLQHWDRFPRWLSWHPMAYALCGNASCIVQEVQRVMEQAGPGGESIVKPALAGLWGQPSSNRPPLEIQMDSLRRMYPGLKSISHFAYSWQDPEFDRVRKFCQLP